MVCARVYLTAVWVVVVILANRPTPGFAELDERPGDDLRRRVANALAFHEKFLDRRVSTVTELGFYRGPRGYQRRSTEGALPYRSGTILDQGTLRRDRQVFWLESLENYPVSENSKLIKLVATPERECNINYEGPDIASGIQASFFSEGPHELSQSSLPGRASIVGGGIWYGYLLADELPEVSKLVLEADWAPDADGTPLSGRYGEWMIDISFEARSDRPRQIEIRRAPHGEPFAVQARAIQFQEWDSFEGVDCPKRVVIWELFPNREGELTTSKREATLDSVGPVQEISDRYGDFLTDVPNGTRVQVDDYMGIDFIWDGEIVRKVDRVKLASLLDQSFFESPLRRYIQFSIGLLTLAIIAWLVWWRTKQQSGSTPARGSGR